MTTQPTNDLEALALTEALQFACLVLAFIGRDQGTSRIDKTLDDLCAEAVKLEKTLRPLTALRTIAAPKQDAESAMRERIDTGDEDLALAQSQYEDLVGIRTDRIAARMGAEFVPHDYDAQFTHPTPNPAPAVAADGELLIEKLEAPDYWMSSNSPGHDEAPHEAAGFIKLLRAEVAEMKQGVAKMCARIATLEAERAALREALEPFTSFAATFIDDDGWSGPMNKERIVDWFGPSDFRKAALANRGEAGE